MPTSTTYYPNQIYTTCAFVGFFFCAICFPWQNITVWTIPICLYAGWVGLACLNRGINSAVWNDTISNPTPIWCDISSCFIAAVHVGISVSALCIAISVYHVTRIRIDGYTKEQERRWLITYLGIGIGVPILEVALYYLIQGHRYDIIEEVGCGMAYSQTPFGIALILVLPLTISTISLIFYFFNLYSLLKSFQEHNRLLAYTSGGLGASHYIRLILLSSCEVITSTPLAAYTLYLTFHDGRTLPYHWASVHSDFSRVDYFPSAIWKADKATRIEIELPRWTVIACAFWFFLFFGTGTEARKNWEKIFRPFLKLLDKCGVKFYGIKKRRGKGKIPALVFTHSDNDNEQTRQSEVSVNLDASAFSDNSATEAGEAEMRGNPAV